MYMIPELNDSSTGNYTCVATNTLGKDSSSAKYIFPIGKITVFQVYSYLFHVFLLAALDFSYNDVRCGKNNVL